MFDVLLVYWYIIATKAFKKLKVNSFKWIFCAILEFRERRLAVRKTSRHPPKHDDSEDRIGKGI